MSISLLFKLIFCSEAKLIILTASKRLAIAIGVFRSSFKAFKILFLMSSKIELGLSASEDNLSILLKAFDNLSNPLSAAFRA